ncbi:hypothetical protein ACET47_08515 [Pseudomonas aeruginosa]|uniref:hypothetical protein n=1 Tax=Pseudomonas aeruginosa TaxID=287 RepID=UPI000EB3B2F1|nr:hypothetical protein [Pseudomonas aeruginosa]MCV6433201.1 hypothetical protein [Pseudomonas aeruginosa]MCV6440831.1 hypothetical protein [Pseudomonas aeruginosa]HBP1105785.1 hypothetical protein [Pseudomonas aeruginosa]HCE7043641.1 hypothetical protein [Pseudomonas aeruginosa]HCE7539296.1 hypothetical protein [Pseudomonas aeruginosa]
MNEEAHPPQTFQVEEVSTEHDELLVLSLGFVSAHDPLDVLHFACGRQRSGVEPPPVEDELYVERTDQSLACDGRDVLSLTGRVDHIELVLSEAGMRLLGLERCTHFRFDAHPELLAAARQQLAAMAQAGQRNVSVQA